NNALGVQCEDEQVPSEDLCRPYIEKALKDLGTGSLEQTSAEVGTEIDEENDLAGGEEASPTSEEAGEAADDVSKEETEDQEGSVEESAEGATDESKEVTEEQTDAREEKEQEIEEEQSEEDVTDKSIEISTFEEEEAEKAEEASTEATEDEGEQTDSSEKVTESEEARTEEDEKLDEEKSDEETKVKDEKFEEEEVDDEAKSEEEEEEADESQAEDEEQKESKEATEEVEVESHEEVETQQTSSEEVEEDDKEVDSKTDEGAESTEDQTVSAEDEKSDTEEKTQDESAETESEEKDKESAEDAETASSEDVEEETKSEEVEAKFAEEEKEEEDTTSSTEEETKSEKEETKSEEEETKSEEAETKSTEEEDTKTEEEDGKSEEEDAESKEENKDVKLRDKREIGEEGAEADGESTEEVASDEEQEPTPEEDLIQEIEIPENLRPRDHINQLLKLDEENEEKERAIQREADIILRDLKRLYDNAIKPLETMYKYRDLSNRHFGESSIINYLLDIEYKPMSLRTGAEPSPAYFNIIMHGEEEEVLDGTQLAADWTFSGLQKFGQGLLDRLRGLRLNNKLLEKVNIVEIPGILEIRKQVQRLFPFNDACQWFIDRADIIFLVYDPAKLDVGPETEAILDQLKGREYQTRIILNKADQVKPEELMRVQGALIWNISPLMSSAEPPIMYSTSLWSLPYEAGAPIRLLYAQERAFLRDLRSAINKRVEHKIASARRFAVRVRNHAKMVDCYLTTYYNHKTFFGNKREISDKIIENPQDYHIYEGLSTLTNISRYDLPDPDVYRDFFRLNSLYDFPLLSSTCTYFRGCPINRLDVSIAYDLPELVGNYKKSVEAVLHENEGNSPPS
ncbi:Sarcalumenin, partial [Trachymyrmex cornetzi]